MTRRAPRVRSKLAERSNGAPRVDASHEPLFLGSYVHFVMTIRLIGEVELERWVRALLRSNIATSAAWPSEHAVRVAYSLRKEARRIATLRSMVSSYVRFQRDQNWRSTFGLAFRFPRFGLKVLRAKWLQSKVAPYLTAMADDPRAGTIWSLAWRHPFFSLRLWSRARFSRDAGEWVIGFGNRDAATTEDESDKADGDDWLARLRDDLLEAERNYLDRQVVSAAERRSDARLFSGPDRENDGFVRLILRSSYHDLRVPGVLGPHHTVFEPRLMLHRSGIAQLDIAIRIDAEMDTQAVLSTMWGPEPIVTRSEMSAPLLVGVDAGSIADYSSGELDAREPLAVLRHPSPVSMATLLEIHMASITKVMKVEYTNWLIYPIALVQARDCCPPSEWKINHRKDLLRLISRSPRMDAAPHVDLPEDLSMRAAEATFATRGSALVMRWSKPHLKGMAELQTTMVFEYALLLYMRLVALEQDVARMRLTDRGLRDRYKRAVALFSELRHGNVRAGEAQDIAKKLLIEFGAPDIRRTVETALELSASAHGTVSAERAARRSWWVGAAATAVAFLVAADPLRNLLAGLPPKSRVDLPGLDALRWVAAQDYWGPWIVLAAVLGVILVMRVVGVAMRSERPRSLDRRRGYRWPVEFRDEGEAESLRGGDLELVATIPKLDVN